jgi:hypothetical protein
MTNLQIKQGQSYTLIGELRDNAGNEIDFSLFDTITVLITSPGISLQTFTGEDCTIDSNKLYINVSALRTRLFENFVRVEIQLTKGDTVIIGTTETRIKVEHTNISKLWT